MSAPTDPADLLDLKMMPAWVNEPPRANEYSDYQGEDERSFSREGRGGPQRRRDDRPRGPKREQGPGGDRRRDQRRPDSRRPPERRQDDRRPQREAPPVLPQVAVRFLPNPAAFESVIAQIKTGMLTYSVFALARLFLDKPERYAVEVKAAEGATLFQLGEHGAVASDRRLLESTAFVTSKDDFYSVEQTQTEPLKGNFTNVARCRLSGTLLGPTNHHSYQPQLRNLYEQRFSRRMSFQDYQRQIEVVSDPAVVEQWKEQARSVTTYTTKTQEPPQTFTSVAEAERHFRQAHLPTLIREVPEMTISGVLSRRLQDRGLGRVIEDSWSAEIRSPSHMMQELASGLRQAGLNIFRHRRGMLFVSPFRIRSFGHERAGVSASINGILEKLTETPGITRKQLGEKIAPAESEATAAEPNRAKMSLASDLHWLISEGYVIEFNDGTLDLPRAKAPPPAAPVTGQQVAVAPDVKQPDTSPAENVSADSGEAAAPRMESQESVSPETTLSEPASVESQSAESSEISNPNIDDGGISVEQTIEPGTASLEAAPSDVVESQPEDPSPTEETVPSPS